MKKLSLFLFLFVIMSCVKNLHKEDPRQFNSENEWIYDIMKNNYLYRDDMLKRPDYSQTPENFFVTLLSTRDGKGSYHFSKIETRKASRSSFAESTYGLLLSTYVLANIPQFIRVMYVMKDSPAYNAGIERGDYIFSVDNEQLSSGTASLLLSGPDRTLNVVKNCDLPDTIRPKNLTTIKLSSSLPMEDNPIYSHKVINQNNVKIGYILYNHFTSGVGEDSNIDHRYNDALCTLSKELYSQGVTELILDFRYNGGGEIDAAQLLATLIAPKHALGNLFCKLKGVNGSEITYYFDEDRIKNGQNLNLNRLFVLTTKSTASASELIINSLRPYLGEDGVVIIGDRTVGKNVASVSFKHEKFSHILKPITHYVYNKEGRADYDTGFEPSYATFNDYNNAAVRLFNLGDENEYLLKKALSVIAGRTPRSVDTKSTDNQYKYGGTTVRETDLILRLPNK